MESRVYRGDFANHPLNENLAAEMHRLISVGLVPDWAGKWRTIDVRVGNLEAAQAADQSSSASLVEIWKSRLTPKN